MDRNTNSINYSQNIHVSFDKMIANIEIIEGSDFHLEADQRIVEKNYNGELRYEGDYPNQNVNIRIHVRSDQNLHIKCCEATIFSYTYSGNLRIDSEKLHTNISSYLNSIEINGAYVAGTVYFRNKGTFNSSNGSLDIFIGNDRNIISSLDIRMNQGDITINYLKATQFAINTFNINSIKIKGRFLVNYDRYNIFFNLTLSRGSLEFREYI